MKEKIQRFGGAMFAPVLLFAFAGILVGFSILFMNPDIIGNLASPEGLWYKFWYIVQEGAWTVFNQLPLLFVIGLPIGLAKKQNARACMEALVTYLTFNYMLSAILNLWGPSIGVDITAEVGGTSGLAMIAGIKTLDTGMIGAIIISAIVVYLHNKYFDKELPEFLGIFGGAAFVVMIGFIVMIPTAVGFALVWPKVQGLMMNMQVFFVESGVFGVWIFTFLERILLPTGLHHFVYSPFAYDNAIVEGGYTAYWATHLPEFATSGKSLKEMYPMGFALYGMSKIFAPLGIAGAFYTTAKREKKKIVAGLMIPITLTAIFAGITEPLEFTFLFVAPILFVVHSVLAATMSTICYMFGVTGTFDSGLIEAAALNWIPLFKYHYSTYIIQIIIGLSFTVIYFVVFRFLILKLNLKTPGREDDSNATKLYSKEDYESKKKESLSEGNDELAVKAKLFLEDLGGKENIVDVTNCATRLRVSVNDESKLATLDVFKGHGAHGLVQNGKAVQVIVGLKVPKVRDEFEKLLV